MMRELVTAFFIIGFVSLTQAQEISKKARIELEVDPIAYVFKGYSFHVGIQKGVIRYDVGVFGLETPEFFTENKNFTEYSNGAGIKVDYVGKKVKGWFVGVESDYISSCVTHDESGEKRTGSVFGLGVRGGYRFMFGKNESLKGFYVVPWIGIDKIFTTSDVGFSQYGYQEQKVRIFPTIHAGWRF